jgi:hypothetical protein
MKTYETLDGRFVSEDPGLMNTVFGRDVNGTPIVFGSILKSNYPYNEIYLQVVDKHSWSWINQWASRNYTVITEKEAQYLSTKPNVYGQWKLKRK